MATLIPLVVVVSFKNRKSAFYFPAKNNNNNNNKYISECYLSIVIIQNFCYFSNNPGWRWLVFGSFHAKICSCHMSNVAHKHQCSRTERVLENIWGGALPSLFCSSSILLCCYLVLIWSNIFSLSMKVCKIFYAAFFLLNQGTPNLAL